MLFWTRLELVRYRRLGRVQPHWAGLSCNWLDAAGKDSAGMGSAGLSSVSMGWVELGSAGKKISNKSTLFGSIWAL